MREKKDKLLLYIFNRTRAEELISITDHKDYLKRLGYQEDLDDLLDGLAQAFAGPNFPHEIGLLLDYPLEDVRGYIDNKSQNYLYAGTWKAYTNPGYAKRKTKIYNEARDYAWHLYNEDFSLAEISRINERSYI